MSLFLNLPGVATTMSEPITSTGEGEGMVIPMALIENQPHITLTLQLEDQVNAVP